MNINELINFINNSSNKDITEKKQGIISLLKPVIEISLRRNPNDSFLFFENIEKNIKEWLLFLNGCDISKLRLVFSLLKDEDVNFNKLFYNLPSVLRTINFLLKDGKNDIAGILINFIIDKYPEIFFQQNENSSSLCYFLEFLDMSQVESLVSRIPVSNLKLFVKNIVDSDYFSFSPVKEVMVLEEVKYALVIESNKLSRNDAGGVYKDKIFEDLVFIHNCLMRAYHFCFEDINKNLSEFLTIPNERLTEALKQVSTPISLSKSFNELEIYNATLFNYILNLTRHIVFHSPLFLGSFFKYLEPHKIELFLYSMECGNIDLNNIVKSPVDLRIILQDLNSEQMNMVLDNLPDTIKSFYTNPDKLASVLNGLSELQIATVLERLHREQNSIFNNPRSLDIVISNMTYENPLNIFCRFISEDAQEKYHRLKDFENNYPRKI